MDEWSPELDASPEERVGLVKSELQPGERLLRAAVAQGCPPAGSKRPVKALAWAVAGFGCASIAFYVIFGPLRPNFIKVEGLMIGVGVVSSAVGLISGLIAYFAIDRRWEYARFASNTYALTDRRAIIWVPQRNTQAVEIFSFTRGSIRTLHRLEYPDGSGSVRFNMQTSDSETVFGPTGFEGVADVRVVEDLVRRTLLDPDPAPIAPPGHLA